jgi:hypothetical protein
MGLALMIIITWAYNCVVEQSSEDFLLCYILGGDREWLAM